MSEARCDLTDLLISQCACKAHRNSPELPRDEVTNWFPAAYGGTCAADGCPIRPGDEIRRVGRGYIRRRCET